MNIIGIGQVEGNIECNNFNDAFQLDLDAVKNEPCEIAILTELSNYGNSSGGSETNFVDHKHAVDGYQEQDEKRLDEKNLSLKVGYSEFFHNSSTSTCNKGIKNDIDIFYEDIKPETCEEKPSEHIKYCEVCYQSFGGKTDFLNPTTYKSECSCQKHNEFQYYNILGQDMTLDVKPLPLDHTTGFKMESRAKKMLRLANTNLIQTTDNESTKTFAVCAEEDSSRNESTNSSIITFTSRDNSLDMVDSKKENNIKGRLSQTAVVNIAPRKEDNISTNLFSAAEHKLGAWDDVQLPVLNGESVSKNTVESFGGVQEASVTPNISFTLDTIISSSTPNIFSEGQINFIEHESNADKLLSLSGITFTDVSNLVEGMDISNIFSFKQDGSNVATDESIISKSISSGESETDSLSLYSRRIKQRK